MRQSSWLALWISIVCFLSILVVGFSLNPYTLKVSSLVCSLHFLYPICFGIDAMNYWFLLLTAFIFPLCFLLMPSNLQRGTPWLQANMLGLEAILLLAFSALDFGVFYVFFELSLIPMFFLVGFWGGNFRRTKAAYYLFLYTFLGSLGMLGVLLYFCSAYGSLSYYLLLASPLDPVVQKWLWPLLFFCFAVKVPMYPLHIWLPEAHVEAPTVGSVILAAIVLKLGCYGFLRYLLPVFPLGTSYYAPAVITLALLSATYAAFAALRQLDMKRIVAYSSIAHMNFAVAGLFVLSPETLYGSITIMLAHGLVSAALFFLVGVLYDRYHTRLYSYFGGLLVRMPLFGTYFFFFSIANVAFPGTWNFVGEVLILTGLIRFNALIAVWILGALLLTTIFTFILYNRLFFGGLALPFHNTKWNVFLDCTRTEHFVFALLASLTLAGGIASIYFSAYQGLGLYGLSSL